MAVETKQIILRKGFGIPTELDEAELGYSTDNKDLYVGVGGGSVIPIEKKGHKHVKADITDFAHQHTVSEIFDFPSSMPASDVQPWAKNEFPPSYSYNQITSKPNFGDVSLINKPNDATKQLIGDGTWETKPNPLAKFLIFYGSQVIDLNIRSVHVNTNFGGLKNAKIIVKWSSTNAGYSNIISELYVNASGLVEYYYVDGQPSWIEFRIQFNNTQFEFSSYFDDNYATDYTLHSIELLYNK
jgi:hypothetical protein